MKFVYRHGIHFSNKELIESLSEAAGRLAQKLNKLNLEELAISDYIRNYAIKHIEHLEHTLQMYTYLFYLAFDQFALERRDITLVDYGGGTGILSFLAAELGLSKIIYTDVYELCCHDAGVLAKALGYDIEIVEGGVLDLVNFCEQQNLACNIVLSSEVIEHVYDIEELLDNIPKIGMDKPMRLVLETAANSLNPMINRRLMKAQLEVDRSSREMVYGKKKQDSLQAYFDIRRDIIKEFAKENLNSEELQELANRTRGKIKEDILLATKHYLETQQMPRPIAHPSNTCDPITGNWCEKLMNPYELNKQLEQHGFQTEVLKGFYGTSQDRLGMAVAKGVINTSIGILGSYGLHLAPYYVLWAERD